jgi:hypothetical protein
MLQPFLFVGVGGSGGKTLRAIKAELTDIIEVAGWDVRKRGFPAMWQFLHIDTPYIQDGESFNARMLEPGEYLGIVNAGVELDNILETISGKGFSPLLLEEVMSPLPRKGEHKKHVDQGASQYRAIGRTVAISKLKEIRDRVRISLVNMKNATSESHALVQMLGGSVSQAFRPNILVISSLAGGSGSGQFLDVCEAIKAAEPTAAWVNSQTAILYAPDVFDDPKITDAGRQGIAPNSLAAMGELVNGRWRAKRTATTEELYSKFGFAEATGNTYNLGPKTVYLIGKSNGLATFKSQNDVYFAAAASLAKWATDSSITENISHYLENNTQATPDAAGLMVSLHHSAVVNSLGFARVSLGIDSFSNFAAQRIARSAVSSLVKGHLAQQRDNETDIDVVSRKAKDLRNSFFAELRIDPSVVIEDLQPLSQRNEWKAEYSAGLYKRGMALPETSLNASGWKNEIAQHFTSIEKTMSEKWRSSSESTHKKWVTDVQKRVLDVSIKYAANYGTLVVIELLNQVQRKLSSHYSNNPIKAVEPGFLMTALNVHLAGDAPGVLDIMAVSVDKARDAAADAALTRQINISESLVKRLLEDLQANFFAPLIEELKSMNGNLLAATKSDNYANTGENVFKSWPDGNNIPERFVPAQNVRLLVPHTSFNSEFNRLLGDSVKVEGAEKDAIRTAVQELVSGSEYIPDLAVQASGERGRDNVNRVEWSTFKVDSNWWPAALPSHTQRAWYGKFIFKLEDWEDNAKKYVRMESRPLGKFIHTTLFQWLNPQSDFERQENEDKLVAEFAAIIKLSKPFSELNPTLHSAAHGGAMPSFAVFVSELPARLDSQKSSLGLDLKNVLTTAGLWDASKADSFKGDISTSSIDIFSTLSHPVHHFVFDNLMKPINEGWKKAEGDPDGRKAFMLRRQARTLPETVPMAPEILDGLIRGWYVAKLLGRLKDEKGETGQGPKLSVFQEDPMRSGWELLPYPLYFGDNQGVVPENEYPAVVVASAGLALAQCSDSQSMQPFAPYRSLMLLGGPVSVDNLTKGKDLQVSETLRQWVLEGVPSTSLSPPPKAERAGTQEMSVDERKNKVIQFFEQELTEFKADIVDLQIGKKHDTLIWEMRREIISALQELLRMSNSIKKTSGGV